MKLMVLLNLLLLFWLSAWPGAGGAGPAEDSADGRQESPQRSPRREEGPRRVFRDRVLPHWYQNNTRFWYRNDLAGGAREFITVDVERGAREPAFDHARLAAALAKATVAGAGEARPDRLPFESIEFLDGAKAVRFRAGETLWDCDLNSYECRKSEPKTAAQPPGAPDEAAAAEGQRRPGRRPTRGDGDRKSVV